MNDTGVCTELADPALCPDYKQWTTPECVQNLRTRLCVLITCNELHSVCLKHANAVSCPNYRWWTTQSVYKTCGHEYCNHRVRSWLQVMNTQCVYKTCERGWENPTVVTLIFCVLPLITMSHISYQTSLNQHPEILCSWISGNISFSSIPTEKWALLLKFCNHKFSPMGGEGPRIGFNSFCVDAGKFHSHFGPSHIAVVFFWKEGETCHENTYLPMFTFPNYILNETWKVSSPD